MLDSMKHLSTLFGRRIQDVSLRAPHVSNQLAWIVTLEHIHDHRIVVVFPGIETYLHVVGIDSTPHFRFAA